jgi:hypothetical protein
MSTSEKFYRECHFGPFSDPVADMLLHYARRAAEAKVNEIENLIPPEAEWQQQLQPANVEHAPSEVSHIRVFVVAHGGEFKDCCQYLSQNAFANLTAEFDLVGVDFCHVTLHLAKL